MQARITRWNSTFYMLSGLLEQKYSISYHTNSNILNLSAAHWELSEQFSKLLQPFEETKIMISGYSCISEIVLHSCALS